jgi:uncharacterized protein YlxP (DUF503 family)
MVVGCLRLHIRIPGCGSLKEKRGRLQPMLHRMRKTFNVAAAETDHQDVWQSAEISVVTVSGDGGQIERQLEGILAWFESSQPDFELVDDTIDVVTGWS